MKTKFRLLIWTLSPPPLGLLTLTVYEALCTAHGFQGIAVVVFMLPVFLPAAYLVSGIPSVIYALAMEGWFRSRVFRAGGAPGVVAFSTMLGTLSGYAIHRSGIEPGAVISGTFVGFILGCLTGVGATKVHPAHATKAEPFLP